MDSSLNNMNNNAIADAARDYGNEDNEPDDSVDGQRISTSDRRKMFETRSLSMQDGVSSAAGDTNANNGNGPTTPTRQPRLSVAERLKMFQQGGEEKPQQAPKEQIVMTQSFDGNQNNNGQESSSGVRGSNNGVLKREGSGAGNISNGQHSRDNHCPAPIPKPERKSLTKIEQASQNHASPPKTFEPAPTSKAPVSNKRIDTVFGKLLYNFIFSVQFS